MHSEYDLMAMLLLGLTGTGHCLGMCGPLVVAIPGQTGKWSGHLFYHCGRLITYTFIGALLGAVGSGLLHFSVGSADPLIWVTRLQMLISALAAALLLILGLQKLGFFSEPQWLSNALPHKIPFMGNAISRNMQQGTTGAVFFLGLVLGLIPCGLSYAAFARALAAGGALNGAQLTFSFGLGTLPGLLVLGTGVGAFWRRHRQTSEIIAGLIMIGMALSLAVRMWSHLT